MSWTFQHKQQIWLLTIGNVLLNWTSHPIELSCRRAATRNRHVTTLNGLLIHPKKHLNSTTRQCDLVEACQAFDVGASYVVRSLEVQFMTQLVNYIIL